MKVGFIGLGIMGKPMSKNLLKHRVDLMVYDKNVAAVEELSDLGAKAAAGCQDIGMQCEIIITMLPNSPQVREVLLGEGGVVHYAKPGAIIIDMSSIDPVEARNIGQILAEKGIEMMDAPVSGGEPKAVDGTLTVMVGGNSVIYEECEPLLHLMAATVVLVGELGCGNIAKLANQVVVGANIAALAEALVLATKLGASPERVFEAIRNGLAGSTVMEAKAPMMLDRRFAPGFRIGLHIKDLTNALSAAHACAAPVPLTASVMEMMTALKCEGWEGEDHSSLIKYYEKLANVKVER